MKTASSSLMRGVYALMEFVLAATISGSVHTSKGEPLELSPQRQGAGWLVSKDVFEPKFLRGSANVRQSSDLATDLNKSSLQPAMTYGKKVNSSSGAPRANVTQQIVRRVHRNGWTVEMPVAVISGSKPGPTFAVIAGMHGGEYAGIFAAQKLIRTVKPDSLSGRLIVVPVISSQAFMMRYMQLSPVDQHEAHAFVPGNSDGSYTEFLIDVLYSIIREANYLIDMHAGEFAQALMPWVPVPMVGTEKVQADSRAIAEGFRVPYLELRSDRKRIPRLAAYLSEKGIANVWSEVGKNGLPTSEDVEIQHDGAIAAMQTFGMLPGNPQRPPHKWIGQRRYQVTADQSGVWHSAVKEGDIVEEGQHLGELQDYFGNTLRRYEAPFRAIVMYYWSSPAINHLRRPHGYAWHSGLVSLASLAEDEGQ